MYLVVFLGSFLLMVQQLFESRRELEKLNEEKEKAKKQFLELISNRQKARIAYDEILYIESLSDYIKVHTVDNGEITSKEKISALAEKLPAHFVRIHRSFVVNANKLTRFNSNQVELDDVQLNIGRSYKQQVSSILRGL